METYAVLKPSNLKVEFKVVNDLSLECLQKEVEGYIECVYNPILDTINDENLVAVFNEEGLILNLQPNIITRAGTIHGNIVFCSHDDNLEELVGLNQTQINFLKSLTGEE